MPRTTKSKTSKIDDGIKDENEVSDVYSSPNGQRNESFEEALSKLELIVKELETGELTLEKSLAKFAEGVSLAKICLNTLDSAQTHIDKILREEDGTLTLQSFKFHEGEA